MAAWTIDGVNLKNTYGITVTRSTGFLDLLPRKGETGHSWPDEDGEESYTDAADIVFESREIVLHCIMQGTSKSDLMSKRAAFVAAIDAPGLRVLANPHTGLSYSVYRAAASAVTVLSKWNPGKNTIDFALKLIEPDPTH
jgi:hypothetical protein